MSDVDVWTLCSGADATIDIGKGRFKYLSHKYPGPCSIVEVVEYSDYLKLQGERDELLRAGINVVDFAAPYKDESGVFEVSLQDFSELVHVTDKYRKGK